MIAVIAVAYGTQAPGLAAAEFAPAARQAVEPPPTTTPDDLGSGGRASRRATTTTAPAATATTPPAPGATPPTTRVGRGRACFGNPPRQTEDPMSPACMATIFEGDNGGAAAPGVTSTEIRVGVPGIARSATDPLRQAVDALIEHANQRFELYGRRLVPVYMTAAYGEALSSRALGAELAAQGIFGALTGRTEHTGYVHVALAQELARNKVVTVTRNAASWWSDRTLYDASHPYTWSVFPSAEDLISNLADFACTALAGRPAIYAGDASLQSTPRRFGVISMARQSPPSIATARDTIAACSEAPATFQWNRIDDPSSTTLRTYLNQLKADGVTTVLCACETDFPYVAVRDAVGMAGFRPEWLIIEGHNDSESLGQTAAFAANYMALEPGPRLIPLQARPWFRALLETRPNLVASATELRQAFAAAQSLYESIMVLASGIQAAGPHLAADTFAAGLMSTSFPNPGAGQAPYWQPSAGFGPGDHAFYDDYAVAWWSNTAPAVDPGSAVPQGSWCYLGAGERFRAGSYPANANQRLFNAGEPCR